MKQILQDLNKGFIDIYDLPKPKIKSGHVLIKSHYSLLSTGTERMLVNFGKANFVDKAFQQPEKVKQVIEKIDSDGLIPTLNAVRSKLNQPIPLGYSNVGIVIEVGEKVKDFKSGDLVVSNGPHAEIVCVPKNLCAKLPENINEEDAVFTVIGAIALQGIRLSNPTLGETFLVSGLGLIGLITAQILASQNCIVLGVDPDQKKCNIAQSFGIKTLNLSNSEEPLTWIAENTNNLGIDGAIITASTSSSEPVHLAAKACRKRGRIILIGSTGLDLKRDLFYKKELSFQVSCSYGPGRYDKNYEELGIDYPLEFVRWTEQRNFQAILKLIKEDKIKTSSLISHRFPFEEAKIAYELLIKDNSSLAMIFKYSDVINESNNVIFENKNSKNIQQVIHKKPVIGVIGAGNFASRVLIPNFAKSNAYLYGIASSEGTSSVFLGKKFGLKIVTTDVDQLIDNSEINTLLIASRHESHGKLVVKGLIAKKHVYVEKPLCLNKNELEKIKNNHTGENILMVGFNRRFAPLVIDLRKNLNKLTGVKAFVYTCNAGFIPKDHWIHDPQIGGGRMIGEACHFVDLLRYLADSKIKEISVNNSIYEDVLSDIFSINILFENGSIGTVHYFSNGNKSYPKEKLEVYCNGKVFLLDNFRKLKAWGIPGFITRKSLSQDKGHMACSKAFLEAVESGVKSPIPFDQIYEVQNAFINLLKK